ncbi:MAG: hypothetical protein K2I70_03710, partial [Bacilli bacterium]|nr:hypothetical protein [Bacilli bacterium]
LYRELFKDYFESEWEEYLEEISRISSSKVHLNDREYLKEVEPIKLDFTKKREKSHNLAIK